MSELKEPVITIDGASGTGKGTISQIIAKRLKWRLLDSGALYRAFALAAQKHNVFPHNEEELELFAESLTILAEHFDVQFIAQGSISDPPRIILEGEDVTDKIRIKKGIGNAASIVSAIPSVRLALLSRQRAFREEPGLVADGRDMGTVIFPDAELKIFLTASPEERAIRRYNQLKERGINATLSDLIKELRERDRRDKERAVAPLKPAEDAICIDTDRLSIEQVIERIVSEISKKKAFPVTSYITKFAEVEVAE